MVVKSLFSDPEAPEQEAPPTPDGAAEGAPAGDPGAPEVTVERACPHCGAALADDQDWCLECGQSTQERRSGLPGWRTGAAVIAVTLVMASGAVAAAYAALRSDDSSDAPPTTQVAQTPNADQIPPPPPIDIPEETEAEKQAAQNAASAQAPPPVDPPPASPPVSTPPPSSPDTSTPPPVASTPPPVTSTPPPVTSTPPPATSTPPSTSSGGGSGKKGSDKSPKTEPVKRAPLTAVALDPATTVAAPYNPFSHDASTFSGDPKQAFDGDPATSWSVALPTPTDVATPAVGLVIDLGKAQKLRRLTITTTTPGTTVEVYGSPDEMPPATLDDGWKHLATQLDVDGGEKTNITLGDDVTGTDKVRQVMIWFAQGPDDGSTSVGVSEIKLFG